MAAASPRPSAPVLAHPASAKHVILFLAASPLGTDEVALSREVKSIRDGLGPSRHACFDLVDRRDAGPLDLLKELRDVRPTIVHFSGHGGRRTSGDRVDAPARFRDLGGPRDARDRGADEGLFVLAPDGRPQFVSARALAQTFRAAGTSVKLVVLNACYTDEQATLLAEHVDCVVGMSGAVLDDTAITFAGGFYGGLTAGESVATAYQQGRAAIDCMDLPGHEQPRLQPRAGVDPGQLVLAALRPYTAERR